MSALLVGCARCSTDQQDLTKLDRLARSLSDARAIADELTVREISLSLGRLRLRLHRRGRPVASQRPGDGR